MIHKELIKFLFIGVLNTIFYYFLYVSFIFVGLEYYLAVIFATIIGVLFSFKTFSKLVFKNDNNRLIYKFILVYSLNMIFNILIINILVSNKYNLYSAGFIATVIIAITSFLLNKFYVFKEKNG